MSLDNNDLFAIRIDLLQDTEDEMLIIRKLKRSLYRSGITDNNEINQKILDFYKEFGIEWITLDIISQVEFNFNNFNLMNLNYVNSLLNNHHVNSNNEEDQNQDEDYDTDPEMPELEDANDSITNNTSNVTSNLTPNLTISFTSNNNNPFSTQFLSNNFLNAYNEFMSAVNTANMSNLEPVRITLDEKDEKLIKTYKLEKDLDVKCTVCLGKMVKDEEVSELPCNKSHIFHKDCILGWLKNYNNRCPICRKECGDGKKNL
jgi:E3 ubiquitin-protein ligase RHA2